MRVGFGYDIHPLVKGRKLILGGVELESPVGEIGHSDGDVLIHAVIDALLGAAALGDIGSYFPSADPAYKDVSSRLLLKEIRVLLSKNNFRIGNVDATVVLEKPKLLPRTADIRASLAEDLGIPVEAVSVKGKTKEGMDASGKGEAVEAFAVALVETLT